MVELMDQTNVAETTNEDESSVSTTQKRPKKKAKEDVPGEKESAKKKTSASKSKKKKKTTSKTKKKSPSSSQSDTNPPFKLCNYENIFLYLEDRKHFNDLFGNGNQTTVGPKKMTKAAAFNVFAIHMNGTNKQLRLTGRQLQQRFVTYKKKFTTAKSFEEGTGAGIIEADGHQALSEVLELKCPCYERMNTIFGTKPNVTPMGEGDSMPGLGFDQGDGADNEDDKDDGEDQGDVDGNGDGNDVGDNGSNVDGGDDDGSDGEVDEGDQSGQQPQPAAHISMIPDIESDLPSLPPQIPTPRLDEGGESNQSTQARRSKRSTQTQSKGTKSNTNADESNASLSSTSQHERNKKKTKNSNAKTPKANANRNPNQSGFVRTLSSAIPNTAQNNQGDVKGRGSLAQAFERSNDRKFVFLEKQMDKQLNWEKLKFKQQEEAREKDHVRHDQAINQKFTAVQDWMAQGKSTTEIETLVKITFG